MNEVIFIAVELAKTIGIADIDSREVAADLVSRNPVHKGLFA